MKEPISSLYTKVLPCALHYHGVNLYEPNNENMINTFYDMFFKNKFDHRTIVKMSKLAKSQQINSIFCRSNNYFAYSYVVRPDVLDTINKFIEDSNLLYLYYNSLLTENLRSNYLFTFCFVKKYGFLPIKPLNVEEMIYQYEKYGKFKSKTQIIECSISEYNDILLELQLNEFFFKYEITYTFKKVIIKVSFKDEIIEIMNNLTKHSRKNTYVKYQQLVKFPSVKE